MSNYQFTAYDASRSVPYRLGMLRWSLDKYQAKENPYTPQSQSWYDFAQGWEMRRGAHVNSLVSDKK